MLKCKNAFILHLKENGVPQKIKLLLFKREYIYCKKNHNSSDIEWILWDKNSARYNLFYLRQKFKGKSFYNEILLIKQYDDLVL